MPNKKSGDYAAYERTMTGALIGDAVLFLVYLLAAGLGVSWLKIVSILLVVVLSALGLVSLFLTGEIARRRSLWLAVGFGAVLVCLLVSALLNYPSPSTPAAVPAKGVIRLP